MRTIRVLTCVLAAVWISAVTSAALSGCARNKEHDAAGPKPPATVMPSATKKPLSKVSPALVVWVSVDGLRPDYLDREGASFLKQMRRSGAWSKRLVPVYPSLTFATHASQVTGASVAVHGIPGNSFYDRQLKEEFNFPPRPDLLAAEPVWTTATRAGRRVAVFDWPFSQAQSGEHAAAYFSERYVAAMTDEQRVGRVADVLRYDDGGTNRTPISLAMGYIESVDKTGHQVGPDHPAVAQQLDRASRILERLWGQAVESVRRDHPPGTRLYFVVSTDHGMSAVTHLVNLKRLLGETLPDDARIVTGGGTAHMFVGDGPGRGVRIAAVMAELAKYPFARAYTHDTLPAHWRLVGGEASNRRVGDVYVDLREGYTFTTRTPRAVMTLDEARTAATRPTDRPPAGMHSYDPAEVPDMNGLLLVRRYPDDFGGRNLGTVDARALGPTVSTWLGVPVPKEAEVGGVPALVGR